jgi:hypothetical protein
MSEQDGMHAFQDDERFVHILDILRSLEMFGGIIVNPSDDDEVDDAARELERQDTVVSRFGIDESIYPTESGPKGSVDVTLEQEPSGHLWVATQQFRGFKDVRHVASKSDCNKPLSECYDFSCKHETVELGWSSEDDIRNEFHDSGFSVSDRPSESFWLGLAGLRWNENIDDATYVWLQSNKPCQSCHILTPRHESLCQNCDAVLV